MAEALIEVSPNSCACPGDIVIYECTVFGDPGGITIWMGDFFHCSSGNQAIEFVHNHFQGEATKYRTCNNGSIAGRIVRAENNSFTSQLNIILTPDIAGRSIKCAYDNGTIHRVGSLNLTTGYN